MYCKKCGTQIEDDSVFCKSCGEKQQSDIQQEETKEYKSKAPGCLLLMCLIVLIITIIAVIANCPKGCNENSNSNSNGNYGQIGGGISNKESKNYETTRDVTTKDLEFMTKNLTTGSVITVIAKNRIENLKLQVTFFDKNNNQIYQAYEYVGNMEANSKYEFTLNTNFVNESVLLKTETYNVRVYEGKAILE